MQVVLDQQIVPRNRVAARQPESDDARQFAAAQRARPNAGGTLFAVEGDRGPFIAPQIQIVTGQRIITQRRVCRPHLLAVHIQTHRAAFADAGHMMPLAVAGVHVGGQPIQIRNRAGQVALIESDIVGSEKFKIDDTVGRGYVVVVAHQRAPVKVRRADPGLQRVIALRHLAQRLRQRHPPFHVRDLGVERPRRMPRRIGHVVEQGPGRVGCREGIGGILHAVPQPAAAEQAGGESAVGIQREGQVPPAQ